MRQLGIAPLSPFGRLAARLPAGSRPAQSQGARLLRSPDRRLARAGGHSLGHALPLGPPPGARGPGGLARPVDRRRLRSLRRGRRQAAGRPRDALVHASTRCPASSATATATARSPRGCKWGQSGSTRRITMPCSPTAMASRRSAPTGGRGRASGWCTTTCPRRRSPSPRPRPTSPRPGPCTSGPTPSSWAPSSRAATPTASSRPREPTPPRSSRATSNRSLSQPITWA